ncbi:hypothetical protein DL764_006787 [Monosporascus ibericus]|uniref:Uncharacterized protein n=1 Tax=Monosporascus ibericus TaxID=155417 RepID=A0A4V1X9Z5_9PEZI|nr:hypothetical protein DL764_006787 [Monosporascus ibericus]
MAWNNINQEAQGSAKGKGKETVTSLSMQPKPSGYSASVEAASDSNSITSRLASSTTRLAKDLVAGHATRADMTEILSASKGGMSTATPFKDCRATADASTSQPNTAAADYETRFRTTRAGAGTANEPGFSAFLDDTGTLGPTMHTTVGDTLESLGIRESRQGLCEQAGGQGADRIEDGSEVAEFLDSGYSQMGDEDSKIPLSTEEQAALRRALFLDGGQWRQQPARDDWEDTLNFFPDFMLSGAWRDVDVSRHLGTSDPGEARATWVNHWQDVLSSYTDDVWGDLTSLVGEAREELTALSKSNEQAASSTTGALRRLQQILTHVRGF